MYSKAKRTSRYLICHLHQAGWRKPVDKVDPLVTPSPSTCYFIIERYKLTGGKLCETYEHVYSIQTRHVRQPSGLSACQSNPPLPAFLNPSFTQAVRRRINGGELYADGAGFITILSLSYILYLWQAGIQSDSHKNV